MQEKTLGELAKYVGGKVYGDAEVKIRSAATLERAGEGDITFLTNRKYLKHLENTKASAVVVDREIKAGTSLLAAEDPYYAFMQIVVLLHGHRTHSKTAISRTSRPSTITSASAAGVLFIRAYSSAGKRKSAMTASFTPTP
jgi:UDP-3-O-[3-hydroxymyristoyl] glucosamine N-acyltransferase